MALFLKKALAWVKAYWYVPLGLLLFIIFVVTRRDSDVVDWRAVLDDAKKQHQKEVEAIEAAHAAAVAKKEAALRRMEEAQRKIEKEFKRNQRELTETKQKEIKRIIKKTKEDPHAMAEELEKSTGYRVIIVE